MPTAPGCSPASWTGAAGSRTTAVNESLDFVGRAKRSRFPNHLLVELGIEGASISGKFRPWIGVRRTTRSIRSALRRAGQPRVAEVRHVLQFAVPSVPVCRFGSSGETTAFSLAVRHLTVRSSRLTFAQVSRPPRRVRSSARSRPNRKTCIWRPTTGSPRLQRGSSTGRSTSSRDSPARRAAARTSTSAWRWRCVDKVPTAGEFRRLYLGRDAIGASRSRSSGSRACWRTTSAG